MTDNVNPALAEIVVAALPADRRVTCGAQGMSRLSVRFRPPRGASWVGEFGSRWPGLLDVVVPHPDGSRVLVVASGTAYEVDPEEPDRWSLLQQNTAPAIVTNLAGASAGRGVALGLNFVDIAVLDDRGFRVVAPRVSGDGLDRMEFDGQVVRGMAFVPSRQRWVPFAVDVETGSVRGGIENGE